MARDGAPVVLGRPVRERLARARAIVERAAWDTVRRLVPPLDDDRPPGPDIERVRTAIIAGELARGV
ncbi:MAG: hypothetical protein HYU41_07725 [Candidatus Rokubacteria bacterium]|nr:hypothetical protein [Candidatus Rokubacteria bacterium]